MFFYIRYRIYEILSVFNYETSEIDWCECNYTIKNNICEFANTVSSLSYIFLSLFGLYHLKKIYALQTQEYIIIYNFFNKIYLLFLFLGIFTSYFHSTLSYSGQILDEISILLLIFTINIESKIKILKSLLFVPFMFILPSINRFLLLIFSIYRYILLCKTIKLTRHSVYKNNVRQLFYTGTKYITVGVAFWITDMVFCKYLLISLHWLWHIYSSLALYYFIVYIQWINLYLPNKYMNKYKFNIKYIYYIPYIEPMNHYELIL